MLLRPTQLADIPDLHGLSAITWMEEPRKRMQACNAVEAVIGGGEGGDIGADLLDGGGQDGQAGVAGDHGAGLLHRRRCGRRVPSCLDSIGSVPFVVAVNFGKAPNLGRRQSRMVQPACRRQ